MTVEYRQITAFVRIEDLKAVEEKLQEIRVHGVSVSRVKGYGDRADFFQSDWMVSYARVELFTSAGEVEVIVSAILDAIHTGGPGDGIVCVSPVEQIWRARTRALATAEDI